MVEGIASKNCMCYLKGKLVAVPLLVQGSPASLIGGRQVLNSSNAKLCELWAGASHCLMGLGGGSGSSRSRSSHVRGAKGRAEGTHITFPTKVGALSEAHRQRNKNTVLSVVLGNVWNASALLLSSWSIQVLNVVRNPLKRFTVQKEEQ